ncbi:SGNH/GDSL hydrolase family protein [Pseudoroseomonas cervicalis]|uniref:SGNH/GDSL hydrolase family protein n=1 Tax=Teichococcus cervicalis TaxID=204525 RepID=UPI0035943D0A
MGVWIDRDLWHGTAKRVAWRARGHKLGVSGSYLQQWATINEAGWIANLAQLEPHLVTLTFGTNDQRFYSPAEYAGYLQTMISRIRTARPAADILIVSPEANVAEPERQWPMTGYRDATLEMAAANGCAWLDLQPLFGLSPADYASGSARPWLNPDGTHPDPLTGGRAIVAALYRLLISAA